MPGGAENKTDAGPQSCQDGPLQVHSEYGINIYLLCAVGGGIGALLGMMMGGGGRIVLLENVGVGMFGAILGGDLLAAELGAAPAKGQFFSPGALGLAAVVAIVLLLLLKVMRKAVGPLLAGKSKAKNRY